MNLSIKNAIQIFLQDEMNNMLLEILELKNITSCYCWRLREKTGLLYPELVTKIRWQKLHSMSP